MKNFIQEGDILELTLASKTSGSPVVAGTVVGVAIANTESNGNVTVATKGVYDLEIVAGDAMAVGAVVYINPADDVLSDDNTKTPFGKLLEAIGAASTVTRKVMVVQ